MKARKDDVLSFRSRGPEFVEFENICFSKDVRFGCMGLKEFSGDAVFGFRA